MWASVWDDNQNCVFIAIEGGFLHKMSKEKMPKISAWWGGDDARSQAAARGESFSIKAPEWQLRQCRCVSWMAKMSHLEFHHQKSEKLLWLNFSTFNLICYFRTFYPSTFWSGAMEMINVRSFCQAHFAICLGKKASTKTNNVCSLKLHTTMIEQRRRRRYRDSPCGISHSYAHGKIKTNFELSVSIKIRI